MSWFVDARLSSSPGAIASNRPALEELRQYVEGGSTEATRLLFVMAQAGQGKSSVLEQFSVDQAERYLQRQTERIALYIDAQGRGLARLDEVIARQLNELQYMLGYGALVTLVREGLITLVVDGFDELIGSRGTFDDAFRSLSAFLEVLDGRGNIIAAGRSAYFVQEYEARGRLLSDNLRYSLEQAFLKPWTQHDQETFVNRALDSVRLPEARKAEVRALFEQFQQDSQLRDLLSRPLFSRDLLLVLLDGSEKPVDLTADRLIPYLAGQYLRREAEDKLRTGDHSFLGPDQLEEYYRELAQEMWELETRELDVSDAEAIIDTYAEDAWGLSGQAREITRARAGQLPFLAAGDTLRRVKFEHEVFFGYFLASALVPALRGSSPALSLLGRGRLDTLTADLVVQLTPLADQQDVLDALGKLSQARHPRQLQIAGNVGALAAAVVRRAHVAGHAEGLRIRNVHMEGEDLTGVALRDCEFSDVRFDRVDLRNTKFERCRARDVSMEGVLIDPQSTVLQLEGLNVSSDVLGFQFEDEGGLLDLTFDPKRIHDLAVAVGLASKQDPDRFPMVRSNVVTRIDLIARAFRHANPIGTNHSRWGTLFTDPLGSKVLRILVSNGLVDEDAPRQTRGPAQVFYRKRFDEAELLGALKSNPSDRAVDKAWGDLEQL